MELWRRLKKLWNKFIELFDKVGILRGHDTEKSINDVS